MFRTFKIRRAAAQLTASFPEIPVDVARKRAGRMVAKYPHTYAGRIGEYLVHGERVARVFEETIQQSQTEEAA